VLAVDATWYLETLAKDGSRIVHDVRALPFRVGRDPLSDLAEATMGLSRRHAELIEDVSGRLRLTDLDSTNGTFVNRSASTARCCCRPTTSSTSATPSSASAAQRRRARRPRRPSTRTAR
jgi:hypothetical protein